MSLSAGDAVFVIGADLSGFSKELQEAQARIQEFAQTIDRIGKNLGKSLDDGMIKKPKDAAQKFQESAKKISSELKSISLSAGVFGTSVLGSFGMAAKKAADYQSSLTQIRVLGVKDMDLVDEAIRKVTKQFGTDLPETAAVAKDAISTFGTEGQGLADSLVFVEQSAKAATAGYVGLTDAAKATTSILKVFNLNTNQTLEVMDALKVATDLGITDMQRFAPEVSKLNVQFQAAGMTFQEQISALSAMTLVEQDVSRDTMFLTNLLKVLGGGNQEAAKAAKEMGIEFSDSALKTKKLSGMVAEITEKTKGHEDALRKLFPDMDAYNGYLTFARVNSGDYQKILDKVNTSLGETDKAYQDVVAHDPTFHLKQMKAAFLDQAINIGEKLIPAMQEWVGSIKDATQGLDDLEESIPGITDFTANMGVKMGEAAIGIAAVAYAAGKAVEGLAALKAAMAWIAGLGVVGTAGVGAVAAGGIGWSLSSLYDTFQEYGPEIKRNLNDISGAFKNLFVSSDDSLGKFNVSVQDNLGDVKAEMDVLDKDIDERIGHSTWIEAYKRNADEAEKEFGRWATTIETNIGKVRVLMVDFEEELAKFSPSSRDVGDQSSSINIPDSWLGDLVGETDRGAEAFNNFMASAAEFEKKLIAIKPAAVEAGDGLAIVAGKSYEVEKGAKAAGDGLDVSTQKIRAMDTYTKDAKLSLGYYGDSLDQAKVKIQGAVNHLEAWCDILGVSYSSTGKAITQFKEYLQQYDLTEEEIAVCVDQINQWSSELTQVEEQQNAAAESARDYADGLSEVKDGADKAYSSIADMYTGALKTYRRWAGSVQETIEDFEEIFDVAADKLGSAENLYYEFTQYILRMNRRMRAGVETTVLSMSDWIEQVLGITSDSVSEEVDSATRKQELGYDEWRALGLEYYNDANRFMNRWWQYYLSVQSLSLDEASEVMDDYLSDLMDQLEEAADATEESSDDSAASLYSLSTAVKKTASTWTDATTTIVSQAKKAYEAIQKVASAASTDVSGYATGGVTEHPLVMVGERGPELAALPVGTRILSHEDMMLAAGSGIRGYADGGIVGDTYDKVKWVQRSRQASILGSQMMRDPVAFRSLLSGILSSGSIAGSLTQGQLMDIYGMTRGKEQYEALQKALGIYGITEENFDTSVPYVLGSPLAERDIFAAGKSFDELVSEYEARSGSPYGSGAGTHAGKGDTPTAGEETASASLSLKKSAASTSTAATSTGNNQINAEDLQKVYENIFGAYAGAVAWGIGDRKTGTINRPGGGYFNWTDSEDQSLLAGGQAESDHLLWDPLRGYWVASTQANAEKAIAKMKLWFALKRIQETPATVVGFADGGQVSSDWLITTTNDLRKKAPKNGYYLTSNFVTSTVNTPDDEDVQVGYWDLDDSDSSSNSSSSDSSSSTASDLAATELPWMPQEGNELIDLGISNLWEKMAASQDSSSDTSSDAYANCVATWGGKTYVKLPKGYMGQGGYCWYLAETTTDEQRRLFAQHWGLDFPSYAKGGVTGSEIVMVGERGPELAALPVGSRVMSHEAMMQAVAGYANGGVVGSRAVQALADGGLVDIASGERSTGNSTTLTINSPLVQVDRVNASDAQDVDKFVKKVSDVFMRQLSSMGLSLNAVGRA